MQSYLGEYPHAAADRENKFIRAVSSVQKQTFEDWEMVIVSDGCELTSQLFIKYIRDQRIKITCLHKQKMWSGVPRNTGIRLAKGEYIVYLDTDDIFSCDHLETIDRQLREYDWVYFSDLVYNKKDDNFKCRVADPGRLGKCGTSNICHRRSMGEIWQRSGYAREDLYATKVLRSKSSNFRQIETPGYYVCHIPKRYDL